MKRPGESDYRDYYDEPTEYGGMGGDNRRDPWGRPRRLSPGERAQDMRAEGLREARGELPAQGQPKPRQPRP